MSYTVSLIRDVTEPLVFKEIDFEVSDTPHRETLKFVFPRILADDKIFASVYPKGNHNCDGVYFATFQLWLEEDAEELSLGEGAKVVDFDSLKLGKATTNGRAIDSPEAMGSVEGSVVVSKLHYDSSLALDKMASSSISPNEKKDSCTADFSWREASMNPQLCSDSREHGIFNLESLRLILDTPENCGSYCVFIPVEEIAPPSTSMGWALQVDEASEGETGGAVRPCWKEISSADGCFETYEAFKRRQRENPGEELRHKLLGLEFGGSSVSQESRSSSVHEGCDLLLSPEEYPPVGFCGPRILIIGAMKCGTNMLGSLLQRHPSVALKYGQPGERAQGREGGGIWEIHHFTHEGLFNGIDPLSLDSRMRYAATIAWTDGISNVTFDKSPSYLDSQYHTGIAAAAKKLLPNARIVASVCDPAKRFWSHYNHLVRYNLSSHLPDTFDAVVDSAIDPRSNEISKEIFETGVFAPHLLDWIAEFGRDAVLVVTDDEMEAHQSNIALRLIKHVGLPLDLYPDVDANLKAFTNDLPGYSRDDIPETAAEFLYKAYEPSLLWLSEIIDQKEDIMAWRSKG